MPPIQIADSDATEIPIKPAPSLTDTDTVLLPVPYIPQAPPGSGTSRYTNLCWAACCAMVTQALKNRYPGKFSELPGTICQVATKTLGENCCPNPDSAGCDVTADVAEVYKACGLPPCTEWQNPFNWDAVEKEIGVAKRPIEVYFLWNSGLSSHVVLISGYKISTQELYVLDPLYDHGWTRYDDVLNGYGLGGSWTKTYYGIGYSLG